MADKREWKRNRCAVVPQSDGSGHWVIAVDDREDSFDKLIHVKNLLKMFLTLLSNLQHTQTQEVVPERI